MLPPRRPLRVDGQRLYRSEAEDADLRQLSAYAERLPRVLTWQSSHALDPTDVQGEVGEAELLDGLQLRHGVDHGQRGVPARVPGDGGADILAHAPVGRCDPEEFRQPRAAALHVGHDRRHHLRPGASAQVLDGRPAPFGEAEEAGSRESSVTLFDLGQLREGGDGPDRLAVTHAQGDCIFSELRDYLHVCSSVWPVSR